MIYRIYHVNKAVYPARTWLSNESGTRRLYNLTVNCFINMARCGPDNLLAGRWDRYYKGIDALCRVPISRRDLVKIDQVDLTWLTLREA